ncbi:profilin domain protein [Leptospira wolbachii serovar Codice str. CDC]|uniref:Profilin domain protein n=1 Tax=Leptospira wolbachii serovar Codice str. CDC TaxID=1218599 RepID=R9A278_9LEPT|nr:profilin domain protein [Leptospira wolbachii serovar Codice str. CDC]
MKPKSIKPDELSKIFAELKKGEESAIGSYLVKGVRLQISKYNLSGAERVQLLYKRRRTQGMCIVCGKKLQRKIHLQTNSIDYAKNTAIRLIKVLNNHFT